MLAAEALHCRPQLQLKTDSAQQSADCRVIKAEMAVFTIIIIITNEKIKVMLSRKRCRGTLQDYNKGEISKCRSKLWTNRNVFSWCLNGTREETEEMVVDCSMHAVQRRGKHDPPG